MWIFTVLYEILKWVQNALINKNLISQKIHNKNTILMWNSCAQMIKKKRGKVYENRHSTLLWRHSHKIGVHSKGDYLN